jgi:hypothetical protein
VDKFNEVSARKVVSTNSEVEIVFTREYLDKTSNSGCLEHVIRAQFQQAVHMVEVPMAD